MVLLGSIAVQRKGRRDWPEGKPNCNTGAIEASAEPMRSSRTEMSKLRPEGGPWPPAPLETEIIFSKAASFNEE